MLRRVAVILNVFVIVTGAGFVLRGLPLGASLALLTGGLNILMLRLPSPELSPEQPRPRVSLLPIAFNILVMTVGIQGAALGAGYLYGQVQDDAAIEVQRATGQTLLMICPVFAVAGIVSAVEFFRRSLAARRDV